MSNFEDITEQWNRDEGGERWIRRIDPSCWLSALYRLTGFGWHEWETAIVFVHDGGQDRTWRDRDCLIIAGDRRAELNDMPKDKLRAWYESNINGNRNSMETILEAAKP